MKLRCPDCKRELSKDQIFKTLSGEVFTKYKMRVLELEVALDEEKIFCPQPDCKGIIKGKKGKKECYPCEECKMKICFFCRSVEHRGRSCEQNRSKLYKELNIGKGFSYCP